MKPTVFNNLPAEDAAIILALSSKLDIAIAKRIAKGHERKFLIETTQGEKQLLRINDIAYYEWIKGDALMYEYVAAAGINVMRLLDMGIFNEGTLSYQLFTWFDGEDLEEALPCVSHAEQYSTGLKSGALMRRLHTLTPMNEPELWGIRFRSKVQQVIQCYNDKSSKSEGVSLLVRYLRDNQDLLDDRPQTFTHGDWNAGNLILCSDGQIGIIDLSGENDYGDPWWEFWLIPHDLNATTHFYIGQIKGYFEGDPPVEFFRLLCYYLAYSALKFPCEFFEKGEPGNVKCILEWFDDMRNPVPEWYSSLVKGTHDDISEIVGIYRSLVGTPGCTWDEEYPNTTTAENDINNGWLYVLKKQDKIVAVVSIGDFGELSDLKGEQENSCELARIGVHPEFQKQGIGTVLLQQCFEIAKKQGYDRIRLLAAKVNKAALALYEKNGFKRCGEVYRFNIHFYCYLAAFSK